MFASKTHRERERKLMSLETIHVKYCVMFISSACLNGAPIDRVT